MKIGVISDTHLKKPTRLLEDTVQKYFLDVDLIIHAGDLVTLDILDAFRDKEVIAVAGNNDGPEMKGLLPEKEIITAGDFKIGIMHGRGWPMHMGKKISKQFKGVDCLVYGHSHWPASYYRDGVFLFNPGAFSGSLPFPWRRTIGILTIDKGIHGRVIPIT
ncbi:MAG: metallophosphoesterase [Deltaproteobacteria bacterium]|nr:metallophosphoesterase [Deltaproteobacteria bacterium]MBW2137963.1 metallophosphoesterase [Deltaproteobacteria bacterium]